MLMIEKFQNEIVRGPLQRQLIFSGAITAISLAAFAPIQACGVGCAFTATLIAITDYYDYRKLRAQPIHATYAKFTLAKFDKINNVEPWKRTFRYCESALSAYGVIYLIAQASGIMATALIAGALFRITPLKHSPYHAWVAIGIISQIPIVHPLGLHALSAIVGYCAIGFFMRAVNAE